jgi:hypothetical protein
MEFTANFKSLVLIGGFNPSILTPDFLEKYCGFTRPEKPEGQSTPVMAQIVFSDIMFLAELNRFQVVTRNLKDFRDRFPLDVMIKYLEVLRYTPLDMFGINLNYCMKGVNVGALSDLIRDPFRLEETIGVAPMLAALETGRGPEGRLEVKNSTITFMLGDGIKNSVRLDFAPDGITVNNNFEVNGLKEDRERVRLLEAKYPELVTSNEGLIARIGKI